MAEEAGMAAARRAHRKYVRWSKALGKRICERVAAGELIYELARDPEMPVPETLTLWSGKHPEFGAELLAARRAAGRTGRGGVSTFSQATAEEIYARLCEGESFTKIGRDPLMPSLSTIFNWRRRWPEFEEGVRLAKRIQAERFCDLANELAEAATPETAYLTHVRLTHLRWAAGMMAPKVFKLKSVEPDPGPAVETVLFRHFEVEVDPETGKRNVVAYTPNPETGIAEREDDPGWRKPTGPGMFSMPGG